jgi:hypothetical protein
VVLQLFKRHSKSRLIEPNDWADYVETIRPIYQAEEPESMFRVASEYEATLVNFFSGLAFETKKSDMSYGATSILRAKRSE